MTQSADTLITPEMRARIGATSEPWRVEFEPGAIRRYAKAIGDDNPLYRDPVLATESAHGGIIAPPVFLGWPTWDSPPAIGFAAVRVPSPLPRHVTGGTEWRYERPIRAGETLTARATLVDLYVKQGRPGVGLMLFQIIDTVYRDADDQPVVTTRYTDITFEGAADE